MSNTKSRNTKQRIMEAAEDLFYDKGYDGASVDEIVKKANVNKSSIYYYFDGKEDILRSLLDNHTKYIYRIYEQKLGCKDNVSISKSKYLEIFMSFIKSDDFMEILKKEKKYYSISVNEALKSNSDSLSIISGFVDFFHYFLPSKYFEQMNACKVQSLIIKGFFFVCLPCIIYAVIGDKFSDLLKFDESKSEKAFRESTLKAYSDYVLEVLQD